MMVRQTTTTTTTTNTNTTTNTTTKKKRGRPSLVDLQNRALQQQQQQQRQFNQTTTLNPPQSSHFNKNPNHFNRRPSPRRSTRRICSLPADFIDGFDYDDDDNDDDDDERIEKKVKLVVRLPSDDQIPKSSPNSSSISSLNCFEDDDPETLSKKREINADVEDEKRSKATDSHNGTRMLAVLDTGPTTTTPLPDKKTILLLLDKLQKKDTRGVFAEPVDPDELPDYHEIIENPMDFGTVKKKLDGGLYSILEQLEADVYLICSNAMQYNAPSTIYFRQARSIQELAKKEFETLRQDSGHSEPMPRPRRGRPPGSRNMKRLLESSPPDRGVPESSSDATLASREDDRMISNSYNLRKGPSLYRFPRNPENYFDFSASTSKTMPAKYGKKQCASDENRRETYNLSGQDPSFLTGFGGFETQLIVVGLDSSHSYAKSLAQFAADLGPAVWRIASKKIKSVLPQGVEFGPGWVSEMKPSSTKQATPLPEKLVNSDRVLLFQESFKSESHHPLTSGFPNSTFVNKPSSFSNEKLVCTGGLSPSEEWSSVNSGNGGVMGPGSSFIHPGMNGFNGGFGSGFQFQDSSFKPPKSHPSECSSLEASRSFHGMVNAENHLGSHGMPYWQNVSMQERRDRPYPVEPNMGFQAPGSRSSSLMIGSPPQLDLVLQL